MVSPRDNKRKILSLDQRVKVLKKLDQGMACCTVATLFRCGKTQIATIKNQKEAIMTEW